MLVFAAVFDVDTAVAAELVAMIATDANDNDGKMVAADDDVDADDAAAVVVLLLLLDDAATCCLLGQLSKARWQ